MNLSWTEILLVTLVVRLILLCLALYAKRKKERRVGMNYIYFETSAINYLLDNYDDEHIIFVRECIKAITKGKICLSPISMWEIACTGNEERKESLIRTCQLFFDDFVLYPDPIQIMDHFISTGCKPREPQEGFFDFEGKFEQVWREIAGDLDRTIIIGGDLRKFDKDVVKRISKLVQRLIKNKFSCEESDDDYYKIACDAIEDIYPKLSFVVEDMRQGGIKPDADLEKLALLFAHILLILGVSFGSTDVDMFWARRNITETRDRLYKLVNHYNTIIHRGPLVCMAIMAKLQTGFDENRGLYKDCLHAMYIPYCNIFYTNDKHFLRLKEQEPEEVWGRINSIDVFCRDLFERVIPEINKRYENI